MTHRIVLIETQQDVASPLMRALRDQGYTPVDHYYSVDGFLSQDTSPDGADRAPSCIIVAQEVKGLKPLAFADRVRRGKTHLARATPLILTAYLTDISQITAARDHGIDEVCAKPLRPNNLLAKLNQLIANPRPFVISRQYTGPDRRRHNDPAPATGERRGQSDPG
ncbi:hypothetical protein EV659_102230 [Rhodothalassium salexigens DSM 2132]|uniref:Response regulatory domain-containing protein n=1 Tax=Rhodothalassium salexigens DSM 2132 TaxID=1188247 RepID=A0A4R2PPW3_RHOSA|nr:response regulator transcription factor [Rhodothalassium salexigens]MBB4210621.1 DNA-binding response OmpR family regulator [Rhodothalassium salexigens DSM 2132]MBK1639065.1 hypothetical protein [Rhodothalassium salexigens DSM 2132]TCP37822.1 hypothetical protein EV659_102230 [Rhodothalassium salexigens DSM 2132]